MNKIKILIVEDDPNLGKILLEYLEDQTRMRKRKKRATILQRPLIY